jgi:hypothetical protein
MGQIKKDIKSQISTLGSKAMAITAAVSWYKKSLSTFRDNGVVKYGERFLPGKIYVFRYDTPITENIEWWDRNPVVLALDPYNGNDVGINLNMLPQDVKETMLDDLHIKLNGQIKSQETKSSKDAKAQGQLNLTYSGAKRYLDKYGCGFAVRQYKPKLKAKQAVVSYENWSKIVLCNFADFEGISEIDVFAMYKKYYNNKNI